MLFAERYMVEVFLAFSSLWAAAKLLTPPSNFDAYAPAFAFMAGLQANEGWWGVFAAISCILKTTGLILLLLDGPTNISLPLRCLGLVMSGAFWTIIGASYLAGNPDSIAGVPLVLMGVSAWWTLIRFPTFPNAAGSL